MKRRNFLPLLVLCFLVFPSNFTLADVPCPGEKTFVYNVGEAPAPADAIDYISDGISITPEQQQQRLIEEVVAQVISEINPQ